MRLECLIDATSITPPLRAPEEILRPTWAKRPLSRC